MQVTDTKEVAFADAVEFFQTKRGSSPLRIKFHAPGKINIALGNMDQDAQIEFMYAFMSHWVSVGKLTEHNLWSKGLSPSEGKHVQTLSAVLGRQDIGPKWVNERRAPQPGARLMFTLSDRRFDAWYGVPDLTERIPEHMQSILFTAEGEKKSLDHFRQAIGVIEGRYTSIKIAGAPIFWIRTS